MREKVVAHESYKDLARKENRMMRRAPTHCTDTDIVTPANGGHVQNAAPKETSSIVWKAFQDPVKHNVHPDLSCERSQMGCLSTGRNVTTHLNDVNSNHVVKVPALLTMKKVKLEEATVVVSHGDSDGGGVIELGCNCKGDLGAAHKQCAETWFKIRSNFLVVIIKRGLQIVEVNPQQVSKILGREPYMIPMVEAIYSEESKLASIVEFELSFQWFHGLFLVLDEMSGFGKAIDSDPDCVMFV
nr:RINGv domain-containing protein [Tanacetum cinerariifolium]